MPKATIQQLQQQIGELTEALQRERADAVNMRRRSEEQIAALKGVVTENVIEQLLPVIDNFERSLCHVPKDLEGNDFVKGVQGVVKQFEQVLNDLGVAKIKTLGEVFDPALHEAVGMEEGDGEVEVVCEELQPGYQLGEHVIRHAMVKVKKMNKEET